LLDAMSLASTRKSCMRFTRKTWCRF